MFLGGETYSVTWFEAHTGDCRTECHGGYSGFHRDEEQAPE